MVFGYSLSKHRKRKKRSGKRISQFSSQVYFLLILFTDDSKAEEDLVLVQVFINERFELRVFSVLGTNFMEMENSFVIYNLFYTFNTFEISF